MPDPTPSTSPTPTATPIEEDPSPDRPTEEDPSPDQEDNRPSHQKRSKNNPLFELNSAMANVDVLALAKASVANQGIRLGSADAPVKVEVFHDLKCGMCGYWFQDILPKLRAVYVVKGDIQFSFIDDPLIMREPGITLASATFCAGDPNKYLAYAHKIYADMKTSDTSKVDQYTKDLNLNLPIFKKCLADKGKINQLNANVKRASEENINGTPMFLLMVN